MSLKDVKLSEGKDTNTKTKTTTKSNEGKSMKETKETNETKERLKKLKANLFGKVEEKKTTTVIQLRVYSDDAIVVSELAKDAAKTKGSEIAMEDFFKWLISMLGKGNESLVEVIEAHRQTKKLSPSFKGPVGKILQNGSFSKDKQSDIGEFPSGVGSDAQQIQ